ncbi:unnamed protein product [Bursaphelenchus xylophilus]|uniref:(pine wood nematode) hypothetical protein n=1 Tax=Bursaphelenchus xylophilus TaxID=6326 RepID=A0A811KNX0_BURXY|nr:unnamed protein product [Bursaphelenchus xylophilus]CAG9101076.1 unnamed protein product [Bursaphelenchus xylophilus]
MEEAASRKTVLSKFSTDVGENVANLMVKEVVATVDKPGMGVKLVDEQELEWVMQVLDYSLQLKMSTNREFETVQSAVRVYVAWLTTITTHPHPSAPPPMLKNPLNYFCRLLDALLAAFHPRSADYCNYNTLVTRQATEIRQILGSVRVLYRRMEAAHKEHDAEMWSRVLLFVKSANNILLSKPCWPDELGNVMAADLAEHLFDCWVLAAIQGKIPTKSYWKMLSMNAQQWITHVPVIEWWGRKLLALTVIIVKQTFGEDYSDIKVADESLYKSAEISQLREIWWQLLTLFGNPAKITDQAEKICLENGVEATLNQVVTDQSTLSFFLAIHIFAQIVDIFYGDSNVSIDLHENEELNSQFLDFQKHAAENSAKNFHRQSNMSTTSSNHSNLERQNDENQSTLTQNGNGNFKKLHAINQHSPVPNRNSKLSAKASLHHAVSLQTDIILEQAASASGSELSQNPPILKPAQFVWYILKTNKFHQIVNNSERKPSSATLLNLFLPWLRDAARISISPSQRKYSEDVISQRSLSSTDLDPQMSADGPVSRRSFAGSTNSASDISSPHHSHHAGYTTILPSDPSTAPSVDGIAAGKSAALGALCRIVCSKSSAEVISDEQLAQFLIVLHEALVERDRLMLCSLIFYSTELFKLGLKGVEILLPNYITAIDILLTESFKLRLHPSINEVDMRHSCLRALASVISWPTTFGREKITQWDETVSITKGNNNVLGVGMTYEDLRPRILRTLIYALRNETDSMNLQLVLGLCHSFCAENSRYDLSQHKKTIDENDEKVFAISALKQTISAVCDNLCKPQWCAELGTSLAAFDCLNALSTLPTSLLFHEGDHSTGALIVSSLCRFVNSQLQKPPPFHSRDLHSSVVAAFQSLEVWLCAAPILAEMESVINTVAKTIEFGMTGGTDLKPEEYKPASQRVHDAAESLRFNLFGNVGSNDCTTVVDEHSVIRKLGDDNLSLAGFQHFVIDKFSLISLHNLTHADFVSNGLPTVVMVCRTPFQPAHATLIQLKSRVKNDENLEGNNNNNKEAPERKASVIPEKSNENDAPGPKPPKHKAEIPAECFKVECELDKNLQLKSPTPESKQVEQELGGIRKRLAEGAVSPLGDRDQKNVWATASLDSPLCAPPRPSEPFKKCNAVRVFLYDMGLLDRKTFGQDLIALDTANTKDFFDALHSQIDRHPAKKCETVSIFYVRRGQRSFSDILKNTESLETTSKTFVKLISRLGRIRRTREPAFWTGHWQTAFSPPPALDSDPFARTHQETHSLDGLENCIWWSDSQLEIAYQLPSERSLQRNLQFIHEKDDSYAVPVKQQTVTISSLQQTLHVNVAEPSVRVNRPQISPSQRLLITHNRPSFKLQDSHEQKSDETLELIDEYNQNLEKRTQFASMNSFPTINQSFLSIEVGPTPGSTEPPRSARFSPNARNRILSRQKTVDYTRYSTTTENQERKASDSALSRKIINRQVTAAPNTLITNRPNIDEIMEEPAKRLVQRRFTTHSGAPDSPRSPTKSRNSLTNSSTNSPTSSKASSPTVISKPFPSTNSSPSAKMGTSPINEFVDEFFNEKCFINQPKTLNTISIDPTKLLQLYQKLFPSKEHGRFIVEFLDKTRTNPENAEREYTPSSTSSSLAPHSREGSSLTDDSGAISGKRSSDLSQPTAATRTRSTSTVNSECSSAQKPMLMPSNQSRSNGIPTPKRSPDQRVLVVWLEKIEDLHNFPYDQLLMSTDDGSRRVNPNLKSQRADLHIIYLHNFEEGLVQVHTEAIWTKAGQPGPLVDGIVVSIDALPSLLRQTVANISRRKTVEVDQLSPAHRRRQAIAELAKKHGCRFGYTEFLDRFITNE